MLSTSYFLQSNLCVLKTLVRNVLNAKRDWISESDFVIESYLLLNMSKLSLFYIYYHIYIVNIIIWCRMFKTTAFVYNSLAEFEKQRQNIIMIIKDEVRISVLSDIPSTIVNKCYWKPVFFKKHKTIYYPW